MKIVISNNSPDPIYEQIKKQIKDAIFSGELKPDDGLPSIRGLAKSLQISVITTMRAFQDLEKEGFAISVPGKGYYVLAQHEELAHENAMFKIEEKLTEAVRLAKINSIEVSDLEQMLGLLYEEINGEN
ncbi:MAG: GntR family transcriptional regulator [Lactobacillales bacterium]|jgi:GntR family transcriptional regulator|nr:GntR family transcriptional regulator [Lactobacillales bacterium]